MAEIEHLPPKLRRANIDAGAGAVEETARLVGRIRARWPRVPILLRADPGFAREGLMVWCEPNRIDFMYSLERNSRRVEQITVEDEASRTGKPARRFKEFRFPTIGSIAFAARWKTASRSARAICSPTAR